MSIASSLWLIGESLPDQPLTGDAEALALYKAAWAEAEKPHAERCARFETQEKAYHAKLDPKDDVGFHNLAPHYAYEVVELIASNLVDDHPRPVVKPLAAGAQDAADLLERIITQHREKDARDEKLPIWVKRALVHNLSPAKISWDYQTRKTQKRVFESTPFAVEGYVEHPPEDVEEVVADRPTLTLIDPYDFLFDPNARSVEECSYVMPRFHETMASLRKQEKKGDTGIYKNLDQIQATTGGEVGGAGRKKNRVTVVEYWTRDRIIVVANHSVVIRDDPNPYWHGDLPFVVMVLVPDLRKLEGISVVETISALQTALWRSLNQRLDMAELVLNPPIIQSAATADRVPEFRPGARFVNELGPDAFHFAETPIGVLSAAIENAGAIKGDMRDISGAVPALSGAASDTVDQKTATGISIIQSVAQQRLKRMRSQAGVAEKRCGSLELAMIQQLTRRIDAVRVDAKQGAEFKPYTPLDIQPLVEFDIDDVNESLDQQRRRDEAVLKLQNALAVNAAMPGLVNLEENYKDFLEAFDEDTPERFINEPAQQAMLPPGSVQVQAPQGGMPPQGPPQLPPAAPQGGPPPFSFGGHPAMNGVGMGA